MSVQKLPLYHRPSALIFLDDEPSYLEMLAMVLPRQWSIRLHTRINDYLASVNQSSELWEADASLHQDMVDQWHQGGSLPAQVLAYWKTQPQRFALPMITVVDFAMPAATGLQVLQSSPAWPPHRILLTGKADEQTAVSAFNDGLINRFLTKQHPDLVQQLLHFLNQLHRSPFAAHESIWRNALRKSQQLSLQDREVQQSIAQWLKQHSCVEYVILPEPFGLLALDGSGHAHWLQFERYKDLAATLDVARAADVAPDDLRKIAQGLALSNAEWCQAMQTGEPPSVAPTQVWGTGGHFLAAHFTLESVGKQGLSYEEFLAQLPAREVDL